MNQLVLKVKEVFYNLFQREKDLKHQHSEYIKCKNSPEYFINKYCLIETTLTNNQVEILNTIKNKKIILIEQFIDSKIGITTLLWLYTLHQLAFKSPRRNHNIIRLCILSKNKETACLCLENIIKMYNNLPDFLKSVNTSKTKFTYTVVDYCGYKSTVYSYDTNPLYIRAKTFDLIIIDDLDCYPNDIEMLLEEVYLQSYKTIIFYATNSLSIKRLIENFDYDSDKISYLQITQEEDL